MRNFPRDCTVSLLFPQAEGPLWIHQMESFYGWDRGHAVCSSVTWLITYHGTSYKGSRTCEDTLCYACPLSYLYKCLDLSSASGNTYFTPFSYDLSSWKTTVPIFSSCLLSDQFISDNLWEQIGDSDFLSLNKSSTNMRQGDVKSRCAKKGTLGLGDHMETLKVLCLTTVTMNIF